MIDLEEIERTINELETTRDTSYRLCERLAWLYIVRDHLLPPVGPSGYQSPEISPLSGSEFLEACDGVSYPALMRVIDEHMEAIKTFYPKEYASVLEKIRSLK